MIVDTNLDWGYHTFYNALKKGGFIHEGTVYEVYVRQIWDR